jgi:hypothetical protein
MKPCEIPCPKCGSLDVNRTYRAEGESLNRRLNPVEPDTEHVCREELRPFCTIMKAKKEFIEHHCRCCRYDWDSDCLKS